MIARRRRGARRPIVAATFAIATLASLLAAASARADGISLSGTSIAIEGCTIEAIRRGRVIYRDARGQRQQRSIDDVASLHFDGLGELDEAERRIAARDYDGAVDWLIRAALKADGEMQRLWLHVRLARTHDLRGEYVLAAAHAARVVQIEDDAAWLRLEPVSEPDDAGYPAARESIEALQRASTTVRSSEIVDMVNRMMRQVHPIYEQAARDYNGPPIEPGSTISGVSRESIASTAAPSVATDPPAPVAESPEERRPTPPPAATGGPTTGRTRPPDRPSTVDRGGDEIDALLRSGDDQAALEACRRIERDPGNRGLGRFLFQYGEALRRNGHLDDATVMYMRCAILYAGSREAVRSLMETAMIYRDAHGDRDTARRLLERAIREAGRDGRADLAEQAQAMLDSLGSRRR